MRIAYLYTDGRLKRKDRVRYGEAASDFLHGSEELRKKGRKVDLFELSTVKATKWDRFIGDMLSRRCLLPHKVDGELLGQERKILPQIQDYDVVVVAGSMTAYALSIWKMLGFFRPAIVAIQCGMFNYHFAPVQRFWTKHLLRYMWTILFGEGEFEPFCKLAGPYRNRISINECGTDTDFWTPGGDGEGDYIFSIGNDGRRDYELLMKVAEKVDMPFIVVTRLKIKETIPPNVRLIAGDLRQELLSDMEVRDLYRKAKLVIVPLLDTLQPSGQSVCLQAMACQKPVIFSKIKGMWSQEKMRHKEEVYFVPPGDVEAMVEAIHHLNRQTDLRRHIARQGYEVVRKEWDMYGYAERVENVCHKAYKEVSNV